MLTQCCGVVYAHMCQGTSLQWRRRTKRLSVSSKSKLQSLRGASASGNTADAHCTTLLTLYRTKENDQLADKVGSLAVEVGEKAQIRQVQQAAVGDGGQKVTSVCTRWSYHLIAHTHRSASSRRSSGASLSGSCRSRMSSCRCCATRWIACA